jgi:hypothetical protein
MVNKNHDARPDRGLCGVHAGSRQGDCTGFMRDAGWRERDTCCVLREPDGAAWDRWGRAPSRRTLPTRHRWTRAGSARFQGASRLIPLNHAWSRLLIFFFNLKSGIGRRNPLHYFGGYVKGRRGSRTTTSNTHKPALARVCPRLFLGGIKIYDFRFGNRGGCSRSDEQVARRHRPVACATLSEGDVAVFCFNWHEFTAVVRCFSKSGKLVELAPQRLALRL